FLPFPLFKPIPTQMGTPPDPSGNRRHPIEKEAKPHRPNGRFGVNQALFQKSAPMADGQKTLF
ncbi:hypothetical protein, partial [Adlercreutzia equolifaciens]|uniref:hypothetical protein n=1 Tax=Adlercreutzia equolifaciens TaxID=446660 RepID=UPI003AF1414A